MKRKNIITTLLIIILISFFLESGYTLIKKTYVNQQKDNLRDIIDYNNLKEENNFLKAKSTYIEKLEINYSTETDNEFKIIYISNDVYGKKKEYEINERFDSEIDKQIINIKKKVYSIKIISDDLNSITFKSININNNIKFNYYVFGYICCILLLIRLLIFIYKNEISIKDIYKYYITFVLIIGILFICLQPASTYYSWDDQIHFSNTYQLVGRVFKWKIGEFSMIDTEPIGFRSTNSLEEQEIHREYINQDKYSDWTSVGSRFITYSKAFYIIPAIGFNIGRLLKLPFSICFRLGKLMILISYALIMGYAIKISKVAKRLLCAVGLIPSSIFLATQYSYDPAVIAGTTLSLVIIVNLYIDKKEKVTFKTLLIFTASILFASFVKAIYVPFMILFLLVPKDRFKSDKLSRYTKVFSLILLLLVMYTFIAPTASNPSIVGDTRGGDTSVSGQLSMILNHPLGYTNILYRYMVGNFIDFLMGANALINYAYLGLIRGNIFYLYFILLIFVTFTDPDKNINKLSLKYRIYIIITSLAIMALIWTALYLSFTPVGSTEIMGVQPRYFLPFIFPILVCFNTLNIKNSISERLYNITIFAIPSFVLLISIYNLILTRFCL